MSAKNTGGAAFPNMPPLDADGRSATGYPYPESGMTLRDYFAAKAMQGELACQNSAYIWSDSDKLAVLSYRIADAMLKAREGGT